jgi:hypothetical protein
VVSSDDCDLWEQPLDRRLTRVVPAHVQKHADEPKKTARQTASEPASYRQVFRTESLLLSGKKMGFFPEKQALLSQESLLFHGSCFRALQDRVFLS